MKTTNSVPRAATLRSRRARLRLEGAVTCLGLLLVMAATAGAGVQGGPDSCIANHGGDLSLNCTAEDVRITDVNLLAVVDGCSGIGDTATVKMAVDLGINAASRYDIGMYVATDGGTARTGTCYKEFLPSPTVSDPTDAELASGYGPYWGSSADGDFCGDAEQNDASQDPVVRLFSTEQNYGEPEDVILVCRDDNDDGFLDFDYCTGWRNNAKFFCNTIAEAGIVQNAAKCKCGTLDIGVPVPNDQAPPVLEIDKTVMIAGGNCGTDDVDSLSVAVGTLVEYCYRIENTSETDAWQIVVVDDAMTPTDPTDDIYVAFESGLSELENNGDSDDLLAGGIAIGKAGPIVLDAEGIFTNVAIVTAINPATTAPITATDDAVDLVTVGVAHIGNATNIVQACGTGALAGEKCATDEQLVVVELQEPGLSIIKTVMPVAGACGIDDVDSLQILIGGSARYCYEITAAGDPSTHEPVLDVIVIDDWATPGDPLDDRLIALDGLQDIDGDGEEDDLPAGGVATGTSDAFLVTTAGDWTNIAVVTGQDPTDPETPLLEEDPAEVHATLLPPDLDLIKTAMLHPGTCGIDDLEDGEKLLTDTSQLVAFCYYARCGGTPQTHTPCFDLALEDDMATPSDPSDDQHIDLAVLENIDGGPIADDLSAGGLARGMSIPVYPQGIGEETNWALLIGQSETGEPLSSVDPAVVNSGLCIDVVKTAWPASVQPPGADVTFTFDITNVCEVNTVEVTSMVDSIYGDLAGQGTCSVPQVLPPLGTYSCAITEFVGGESGSTHRNVVVVEGTDYSSTTTVTSDSSVEVPIAQAIQGCLHCPSKVRFRRSGQDFFSAAGWIVLGENFDPSAGVLHVELSNSKGAILIDSLSAGLLEKGTKKYAYRDKAAKVSGGFFKVRMKPGPNGLWQFKIRMFGDLSAATEPDMTLRLTFGGISAVLSGTWESRQDGWQMRRFPMP